MQAGPEKRMISMFNEAMELSGRFRKNTYEPAFREFFRRRSTDLEELLSEIRGTEEKSQEELIARAGKSLKRSQENGKGRIRLWIIILHL